VTVKPCDRTALWPFGFVTLTSQARFRGAPPDGTLTVAVIEVLEFTTTFEATGVGPLPFWKVTVAPATKLVPVMVTVPLVPAFIDEGEMLVTVGGPVVPDVTLTVVCALLFAVLVSPVTWLAVPVRVWVPVAVGLQVKGRVCDAPEPRLTTNGLPLIVAAPESVRLTVNDSAWVPELTTFTDTVCCVFTVTLDGAVTPVTATSWTRVVEPPQLENLNDAIQVLQLNVPSA
jgi:hypothetical protein